MLETGERIGGKTMGAMERSEDGRQDKGRDGRDEKGDTGKGQWGVQ